MAFYHWAATPQTPANWLIDRKTASLNQATSQNYQYR